MVVALLVALVVLVAVGWILVTAARLTRLGARVDAAAARLDAELVRRAAAAQAFVDSASDFGSSGGGDPRGDLDVDVRSACRAALLAGEDNREHAENDLARALTALPAGGGERQRGDLIDASIRVGLARRFYNDAVRDARALRGRRLTRVLRLAAHQEPPAFFEIADYRPALRTERGADQRLRPGTGSAPRVASTAAPGRARSGVHVVPKGSPR